MPNLSEQFAGGGSMLKQLEEIERNMYQILNEINAIGLQYISIEIDLWPMNYIPFRISLWDGKNHASLDKLNYEGTPEQLIDWVKRKKILFEKIG